MATQPNRIVQHSETNVEEKTSHTVPLQLVTPLPNPKAGRKDTFKEAKNALFNEDDELLTRLAR